MNNIQRATEYNFDSLVGPTHNYSGLAYGNIASQRHRYSIANPKAAALQGLKKMKLLHKLGVKQGLIPPQDRPNILALRECGYTGSERNILESVSHTDFELLLLCSSASAMWAANAATVSPSADTKDKRLHITPANLVTQQHRAIESPQTALFLKNIFEDHQIFSHHPPLVNNSIFYDEGAANHMRLTTAHGSRGIEIFVYGKNGTQNIPKVFPARQSLAASKEITRQHKLDDNHIFFIQQNPEAIDYGIFHNDVIAVANENVLIYHEQAFVNSKDVVKDIQAKFENIFNKKLYIIEISQEQMAIEEAVSSYFFNSQIVTLRNGHMALIVEQECRENRKIGKLISEILKAKNPISEVHFVDLRQSMRNGGGPACLRLRVVLTEEEQKGVHPGYLLTDERLEVLEQWIQKHYRNKLAIDDLRDYQLLKESYAALDELTQILQIGSIYPFQK